MSSACVELILYEINNNFGKDCQDICRTLLYNEWSTVKEIKSELKNLKSNKILEYLQLLINFNLVQFNFDGEAIDTYQFDTDAGVSFLRLDRYLNIVENEFGLLSKMIFEEFCKHGNLYSTQLLERARRHLQNDRNWLSNLVENTNNLIRKGILEVAPMYLIKNKSMNPMTLINDIEKIEEVFSRNESTKAGSKRAYGEIDESDKDWDIQYRINYSQLNILCVHDIIVRDVSMSISEEASIVMKEFLHCFDFTTPKTYYDPMSMSVLLSKMKAKYKDFTEDIFEDCMDLLTKNHSVTYIEEVKNINGILLVYNRPRIVEQMAIKMLSDMVRVCFGENGLRIFSFILTNPYIEEKVFFNSVIIPLPITHSLLSPMLARGFISKLELSKTKAYNDEPLESLYNVDIGKVVLNEQQTCYQCLYRLMIRRNHEEQKQKPLLIKLHEMSCKDKSLQTIDGDDAIAVITDLDKKSVKQLNQALYKLDAAEIGIHTSLVLFDEFILNQKALKNF